MENDAHHGSCSGNGYAVAELIIDTIKDLSSEHEQVTPDILEAALFGRREFTDLFEAQARSSFPHAPRLRPAGTSSGGNLPEGVSKPWNIESSPCLEPGGQPYGIPCALHPEEIRRFFLELLTELKNAQRWEYSEDLQALGRSIENSESLEEIWSHKNKIFSLLRFANRQYNEELKRFAFLFVEMGKGLETSLKKMTCEVSKAREEVKGLKEEIMVDPLTRICNRRAYENRIEDEWEQYRAERKEFALLLIDIDHFKQVNDTHGHWVGDRCLAELAEILRACLRDSDFIARYGGDEFAAILPATSGESTRRIAQRLRSAVEKTRFMLQGREIQITVSIGGTHVRPTDEDTESIFKRADAGLYEAKNKGRNGFVLV